MGVLIICDNKGCFKQVEPLLNVENNEVICTECGKPIKGVTYFMKVQLKSLGQTMRKQKAKSAYSVLCTKCGKNETPIVGNDGEIYCSNCNSPIKNITSQMAHVIKTMLGR